MSAWLVEYVGRTTAWLFCVLVAVAVAVVTLGLTHGAVLDICDVNHDSPNSVFGWSLGAAMIVAIGVSARWLRIPPLRAFITMLAAGLLWLGLILPRGSCGVPLSIVSFLAQS
jgi:hypothetical protein